MKIINDKKRKKPVTRQLYRMNMKYHSYEDIRSKLRQELKDEILSDDFDLGYFEGRHSTKRWITNNEDLSHMYLKNKGTREIHLWCDVDCNTVDDDEPPHKVRKIQGVPDARTRRGRLMLFLMSCVKNTQIQSTPILS